MLGTPSSGAMGGYQAIRIETDKDGKPVYRAGSDHRKDGQAADDYAKSVLLSDLEIPGDDDIIAKLHGDLAGLGVGVNDIKAMLAEKLAQAEAQISGAA